jgi:hypothetical protein
MGAGLLAPAGLAGESERWHSFGLLAAGSVALAALYLFDPATWGVYPACPFRALTGWLCPGCGTLRGLHQLLHGDPAAAFRFNPLMVVSLPFIGWSLLARSAELAAGRALPAVVWRAAWIRALLGVVVLYGVLRNTPLWPAWFLR